MKINYKSITTKDVFIVALILTASFGYYFTLFIPGNVKEFDLVLFNVRSSGFVDLKSMFHFTKMKILIIIFATIWYLTSSKWWKSSILVILTIELLKLISAFNPNQNYYDEIEYFTSLPITIPIVLLLIYISNKINKYSLTKELRAKIDSKIDEAFHEIHETKKIEFYDIEKKFLELKLNKSRIDSKKYISELIKLRNEYFNQ